MKYYSRFSEVSLTPNTANTSIMSQRNTELQSLIDKNFNLKEVTVLAKEMHSLILPLRNFIFYTYTNEIFEKLYPVRFVLSSEEFCQVQDFIFSYINKKGMSEVVYHLNSSYSSIFDTCPKEHITPNYHDSVSKYYSLALASENSDFSNPQPFVDAVTLPEYAIFHSYSTGMKPFHDFVKFAKHTIVFNYFKCFLFNPHMSQSSIQPLILLADFLPLAENENPRLNEFDLFVKFMEKEHWTTLLAFKNESRFQTFLENIFFFKQPRKNSSSMFYSPTTEHVHLVQYSNLETINNKNINLNVFFDETTTYPDFMTFILKTIEKRLEGTGLTLDNEGHEHLLTLLKTQSYFNLLKKYPEKGILSKSTKI